MPELKQLRILVIEDDHYVRGMLCHLLKIMGIKQIHLAENGSEAVNILENLNIQIDVVLCDWNMPCMTGIDLLKYIRQSKYHKLIFLMISGRMDSNSIQQAKEYGVSDYLCKPISPALLQDKLRQAIRRDA